MKTHIEKLMEDYADDFPERIKHVKHAFDDDRKIRHFDKIISYYLTAFVDAAVKDGCPKVFLLESLMNAADRAISDRYGPHTHTSEYHESVAALFLEAAMERAEKRRARSKRYQDQNAA